ncbi:MULTISPECIES: hypothetical protein [unclassified Flavobacterium]|uniref:hypothetical protein n=1 Tax=unclassified Flavobacterium TaxID=196869 RepID=UPI000EB1EB50|nr:MULTISPECIES: hypothetical protein [unclassified Flavobacterium]RKS02752.1 hypothetical protein C8C84_2481 [Flavobacterium sp. 102]
METKSERKMKNRATNFLTKGLNYQIKGMVDSNSYNEKVLLCEKSMEELRKIYWHEKELLIVIPMLISNATTFELVEMLTVHRIYLRKHIRELEKNFPFISKLEITK